MLTTDQVLGKGRYRIISNFTQDSTGGLYEAIDTTSNSNVVIRETVGSGGVMTPAQLDAMNSAFAGTAKSLSEVRHESLLSVQDYFSEIDRHYLVMEGIDGCDLTKFLQVDEKRPALGDVIKWADQILSALDYLHTLPEPLIHRDIRPANVRLTSSFKVKVLTAGTRENDVIMASAANPADSSVLNYRPLEQLWGGLDPASQKVITNSYDDRSRRILQQPLDARSDIYSVGATLYHVLTRTLPKDALERSIEILDGNTDPLVPPAELDDSIPEAVSEVIMKAMELHREHRYDSAAIMRQVLNSAWQRMQTSKLNEPKPRVMPDPLPTPEPTETLVDLKKADANDLPAPPVSLAGNDDKAALEATRAEERRRELEADLLHQRQEAERIRAAEKVVEAAPPIIQEEPLLEVEPAKAVDDSFEWSVEVSEQPSGSEVKPLTFTNEDVDFNIAPEQRSNLKFVVAGAGALVLVIGIIGWMFIGGSSPAESPKAQSPSVQQETQPVDQEPAPVSGYTEQEQINSNAANTQITAETTDRGTSEPRSENKPAAKDKKPAAVKTPEKKKVTVDDLINDN